MPSTLYARFERPASELRTLDSVVFERVAPSAPAVARQIEAHYNFAAATGRRLRDIPFVPERVKAVLS